MALQNHGVVRMKGIDRILSGQYTRSHGVSPGSVVLQITAQKKLPTKATDIEFIYNRTTIKLQNCLIDYNRASRNRGGFIVQVVAYDRRWKWRFGAISGTYNVRDAAGDLVDDSEQTPQELATLCLRAMGEARFDIGNLPNNQRPLVNWEHQTPALALADLCEQLGCRVALDDRERVKLVRIGVGNDLPDNLPIRHRSDLLDTQERPSAIRLVGGRTKYQAEIRLNAMALDTDGSYKHLDDVSYKPTGGWGATDFEHFAEIEDDESRELARRSVYRVYRFEYQLDSSVIPEFGKVDRLDQILPCEQLQLVNTVEEGEVVRKRAEVWGVWYDSQLGSVENVTETLVPLADTPKQSFFRRNFRVDERRGLVIFSEPIYRLRSQTVFAEEDVLTHAEALLAIRLTVPARDKETRAFNHYTRERRIGNANTQPLILRRPEIVREVTATYTALDPFLKLGQVTDNAAEINPRADAILDAAVKQINNPPKAAEAEYIGIHNLETDGAIQAITWQINSSGSSTIASRNSEQPERMPREEVRRVSERRRSREEAEAFREGVSAVIDRVMRFFS